MKTESCKGLMGWLFGHKFEARYHTLQKKTNNEAIVSVKQMLENALNVCYSASDRLSMVEDANATLVNLGITEVVYVKDVCVHCGYEIINTQSTPERRIETEL